MSETHSYADDVKTSCLKRQHTEFTPDALLYRKTRLTRPSCSAKTAQGLKHNRFSPALLKSVLKNLHSSYKEPGLDAFKHQVSGHTTYNLWRKTASFIVSELVDTTRITEILEVHNRSVVLQTFSW